MKPALQICVVALGVLLAPCFVGAQARPVMPVLDSAQMAGMMARSMRQMKPAALVLGYKSELALTPEQVTFLEMLVIAQNDSQVVRQARLMERMQAQAKQMAKSAAVTAFAWTGAVDEAAVREQACAQSAVSVESTIALINDRHAVGALLTPTQLSRLPMLEMEENMKLMKRP